MYVGMCIRFTSADQDVVNSELMRKSGFNQLFKDSYINYYKQDSTESYGEYIRNTAERERSESCTFPPGYINLIIFLCITSAYTVRQNITAFYIKVLSNTKVSVLLFKANENV